ncbi:DUF1045 domain-containing protein [Aureimonas sp. AU12]|uniref:DUF1045 domain-containing protein n=1 Tax=Aureimonas sp. AU12 TaxID=1638161 RepID=UPI0007811340|nr:DUF1045 domain-containing protein [Aureimonas sp. AU12]
MRFAVYHAPLPGSTLAERAALWLGRDAFADRATRLGDPRLDPLVAEPARYGFHATLKAPFRLAEGRSADELDANLAAFCRARAAPRIERLVLSRLGRFFALTPDGPAPAIVRLEAEVLEAFEPFRAPASEAEVARRRPDRLSERQRALLETWGYPHVLDEFRFHMTLTGPVDDPDGALAREIAGHFAGLLDRPYDLEGLALFVEPEPGAPFRVHRHHSFGAPAPSEHAAS